MALKSPLRGAVIRKLFIIFIFFIFAHLLFQMSTFLKKLHMDIFAFV